MKSEKYRDLLSEHYQLHHGMRRQSNVDPIDALREMAKHPEHGPAMEDRHTELAAFAALCGDEFHKRDYVGHIELIALRKVFETP